MLGVLDSDGSTPTPVQANPSGFIMTNDGTGGASLSGDDSYRDENFVTTLLAVSEADGVTPVPLQVNSSGELLIDSS